jgi:multiple sugar transport system ATP-binding protein
MFGVRPENITLAPTGSSSVPIDGTVSLLEPLGSETLVTLKLGAAEYVSRLPAAFKQAADSPIRVHIEPGHMHLFDADTGAAL